MDEKKADRAVTAAAHAIERGDPEAWATAQQDLEAALRDGDHVGDEASRALMNALGRRIAQTNRAWGAGDLLASETTLAPEDQDGPIPPQPHKIVAAFSHVDPTGLWWACTSTSTLLFFETEADARKAAGWELEHAKAYDAEAVDEIAVGRLSPTVLVKEGELRPVQCELGKDDLKLVIDLLTFVVTDEIRETDEEHQARIERSRALLASLGQWL